MTKNKKTIEENLKALTNFKIRVAKPKQKAPEKKEETKIKEIKEKSIKEEIEKDSQVEDFEDSKFSGESFLSSPISRSRAPVMFSADSGNGVGGGIDLEEEIARSRVSNNSLKNEELKEVSYAASVKYAGSDYSSGYSSMPLEEGKMIRQTFSNEMPSQNNSRAPVLMPSRDIIDLGRFQQQTMNPAQQSMMRASEGELEERYMIEKKEKKEERKLPFQRR